MQTVLMFHDIVPEGAEDDSGFRGNDAALYKITPDAFEAHLSRLAGLNRQTLLTFDDGGKSAMKAADALERYGLIGSFFVTVDYLGSPGFLDPPSLIELRARGHAVGSHSCSHPLRMGHCSGLRLVEEWRRSRDVLRSMLGEDVRIASVPGGDFAPRVAQAASLAGFSELFTSEPTRVAVQAFGLTVRGRFAVQRWTTPETVEGLASGAWLPSARQALAWNVKKITKRLAGRGYLRLRKRLLRHANDVQWGDEIT